MLQVIGVGAQDDFEGVQKFLDSTGMEDTAMLWERQGNFWQLQNVSHNSAMQLYSYDLTRESGVIFFNDQGREVVLDATTQSPWAPADSASS